MLIEPFRSFLPFSAFPVSCPSRMTVLNLWSSPYVCSMYSFGCPVLYIAHCTRNFLLQLQKPASQHHMLDSVLRILDLWVVSWLTTAFCHAFSYRSLFVFDIKIVRNIHRPNNWLIFLSDQITQRHVSFQTWSSSGPCITSSVNYNCRLTLKSPN